MGTIFEFEGDLDKFAKQVGIDFDTVVKKVAFDLFTRIVQKTPVDTGRARASWNISIGEPVFTVAPDNQPAITEADISAKASRALAAGRKLTEPVWITNNLPYIIVLEHGGYPINPKKKTGKTKGGFSVQAPHGMVALSIEEVKLKMSVLTKVP
ncbi:MAG: hypothetical protein Q8L77_14585 [Nitrospirota bacterium]|nr:hypothetical protein [Nitrospirota bacterium]